MNSEENRSLFSVRCPVAFKASSIFTNSTKDSTYCLQCERKVAILAGKSLLEIAAYMKANPKSCIIIGGKLESVTEEA